MMPSSGGINCFAGLTDSVGSIYLSVKMRNLGTSRISVFPFVSPDNARENRFLPWQWFCKCPLVYQLPWKELSLKKSLQGANSNPRVLRPQQTGLQTRVRLYSFALGSNGSGVAMALGTLLEGCFRQAGWHLVCLYCIETVFALASLFFKC